MYNSNLIKYLQFFDKAILNRWLEYICSPYFNKHQPSIALCKLLYNEYPFTDEKCIDKKLLYKRLNQSKSYDDDNMRWLISNLLRLTEAFIYQEKTVIPQLENISLVLLPILKEEFQFTRHTYHLKRAEKKLLGKANYEESYKLYNEIDDANIYKNNFNQPELLLKKNELQHKWLLYENLRNACDIANRRQFVHFESNNAIGEWAINQIKQNEVYKNEPALMIYYRVYFSITTPADITNYQYLQTLVFKNQNMFEAKEQRNLFYYLLNYSLRKINSGASDFLETAFNLFVKMLDSNMFLQGDSFPENVFKNIITIALRLNKTDWVKQFIEDYAKQLPIDVATNAHQYNMANYYYHIGEMNKAMQQLINVEYTNINYNLDSKALLLRIYFDMDEEEAFDAHFNAFKVYLIRNKLLANKKHRRYYNLFRFTNRLYHLKSKVAYQSKEKTKQQLKSLQKQMDRAGSIANVAWLEKRITDLED